jgi:hypothetical protein
MKTIEAKKILSNETKEKRYLTSGRSQETDEIVF